MMKVEMCPVHYILGDLCQSNFRVGGGETQVLWAEWEMKSGDREYGLLT